MTRRSVGGAARGPITPSPSSSLGVSIPFEPTTPIRRLRGMLAYRDRLISRIQYVKGWYGQWPKEFHKWDIERRMIRERIKQLAFERKAQ